jgi:hypothetical protein
MAYLFRCPISFGWASCGAGSPPKGTGVENGKRKKSILFSLKKKYTVNMFMQKSVCVYPLSDRCLCGSLLTFPSWGVDGCPEASPAFFEAFPLSLVITSEYWVLNPLSVAEALKGSKNHYTQESESLHCQASARHLRSCFKLCCTDSQTYFLC